MKDAKKPATREDREYRQWAGFRKAKRGRVHIDRSPLRRLEKGDGVVSVHGAAIIVTPAAYDRNSRRAFVHYCEKIGITLVPAEVSDYTPPGISESEMRPESRIIAWQCFGSADAIKSLILHRYVVQWNYCTTLRGPGCNVKLAHKPRVKGKDDVPPDCGKAEIEREQEEIREATDAWMAENAEDATDEDVAFIRPLLIHWYGLYLNDPTIEDLAELAEVE